MTIQTQGSVQSQVLELIPRNYEVFGGVDVDHHSIVATFADHGRLLQSLRPPYSARQLLNYVRKHFPGQRLAFVYEAGPTGFGLKRFKQPWVAFLQDQEVAYPECHCRNANVFRLINR